MPPAQLILHESIQALLREGLPGEDASDIIRRKARQVVKDARPLWTGPPFCPIALASMEGVTVREAVEDIRSDGRIFPYLDKIYIEYAQGQCRERMRFTVCHELAHTLFPDCYSRERRRSKMSKEEREFESLCHLGASEFLFPEEEFARDMATRQLTGKQVQDLASRYEASVDATAHRIVDLCRYPMSVVFAKHDPSPGKKTILVVRYAVKNDMFQYDIRPNLRINTKSVANTAFLTKNIVSSPRENWFLKSGWAHFRAEAIPLPLFETAEASDIAMLLYH